MHFANQPPQSRYETSLATKRMGVMSSHHRGNSNLKSPRTQYGIERTAGLPAFEGQSRIPTTPTTLSPVAPETEYLAAACSSSLDHFRQQHKWDPTHLPNVETALRILVQGLAPTPIDHQSRIQTIQRLRALAQSGINFCRGLDLEAYGSFVSGLYTNTGDLDLSIEGTARLVNEYGMMEHVSVQQMERHTQIRFLNAMAARLRTVGARNIIVLRHARIPIIKFLDGPTGIECDVSIANPGLFKSAMMGLMQQFDWRVGALVRLVKVWARSHNLNDASQGTFNSFALTLLVIFHLQTRNPPILPCIGEVLDPETHDLGIGGGIQQLFTAERPMQDGRSTELGLLEIAAQRLDRLSRSGRFQNGETLLELIASFFALYGGLMQEGWLHEDEALARVMRRVRINTWDACFDTGDWPRNGDKMLFSVEDPFDSLDNCARTIREPKVATRISQHFSDAAALLTNLSNPQNISTALHLVFGPTVNLVNAMAPFSGGGAGSVPAISWVPPTELWYPEVIREILPTKSYCIRVDHTKHRGTVVAAGSDADDVGFKEGLVVPIQKPVPELLDVVVNLERYAHHRFTVEQEQAAAAALEAQRSDAKNEKKAVKLALKLAKKAKKLAERRGRSRSPRSRSGSRGAAAAGGGGGGASRGSSSSSGNSSSRGDSVGDNNNNLHRSALRRPPVTVEGVSGDSSVNSFSQEQVQAVAVEAGRKARRGLGREERKKGSVDITPVLDRLEHLAVSEGKKARSKSPMKPPGLHKNNSNSTTRTRKRVPVPIPLPNRSTKGDPNGTTTTSSSSFNASGTSAEAGHMPGSPAAGGGRHTPGDKVHGRGRGHARGPHEKPVFNDSLTASHKKKKQQQQQGGDQVLEEERGGADARRGRYRRRGNGRGGGGGAPEQQHGSGGRPE